MLTRVGRRLSYVIPLCVILWLGLLGELPWWAVALLAGGSAFAMDRLWGVPDLLDVQACFFFTSVGLLCLGAAIYLASGLNLSLGEYFQLASEFPRKQRLLRFLPVAGLGLCFYGLLGLSSGWFLPKKERQ